MPMMEPSALAKIAEKENTLAPHNDGIYVPITEPRKRPIQINSFPFILYISAYLQKPRQLQKYV